MRDDGSQKRQTDEGKNAQWKYVKFDQIHLNETGGGRKEALCGKPLKDNGNMEYGEIKRK